jgi:hypothetical protein
MKFFLTIYICSALSGKCVIPVEYPKPVDNYYDCVREGLSASYDILYQGDFSQEMVESNRLYPRYVCEKAIVPERKPDQSGKTSA